MSLSFPFGQSFHVSLRGLEICRFQLSRNVDWGGVGLSSIF